MFSVLTSLTRDSEQKLAALGVEFGDDHCIVSMTDGARSFLQDSRTAATTVSFAFGAEYHQYLKDDPDTLSKVSVPLLMSIAQPRFAVENRRKACAILRRKLPKILANFTAVKREKMAFPINIVEKAYCQNPKFFKIVAEIKTDSEGKRKKEMEVAAVEKEEMIQKGGGSKRRKKSSKRRH
uniref:Uncharacterized protein n=1 Tax=Panagrolaimus superbus TaxID=310955 RepID=A0A914YLT0_9BILA